MIDTVIARSGGLNNFQTQSAIKTGDSIVARPGGLNNVPQVKNSSTIKNYEEPNTNYKFSSRYRGYKFVYVQRWR